MLRLFPILAIAAAMTGCATGYTLVAPGAKSVSVARGAMKVQPSVSWNKAPHTALDIPREETWTQNGLLLDSITFVGGLRPGEALAKQRPKDDRKVPEFRADMTPQDLVSMIESCYRIRAGATVFNVKGVKPAKLSGNKAMQFDYSYVGADEVKRAGRSVFAVVEDKFYLLSVDGAAVHYFDAALPEFERILASAVI